MQFRQQLRTFLFGINTADGTSWLLICT